ncbi:ANTAR domain-containing protein [Streptomyces sp. NPDC048337]|uniref:ANTAR domain-containing protein n=1 Tax=Streptomyces sp. NPDC048337 TaxID=3365535 RepID=UPI0037205AA0
MEGDSVLPETGGCAAPEVLALAKVVARLRTEVVDLEGVASVAAVVERAKGVLMAQAGVSAEAAHQLLLDRAEQRRRTLLEESWITLSRVGSGPPPPAPPAPHGASAGSVVAPQADGRPGAPARVLLARLAEGLAGTRTADDVAELLRAVLGDAEAVDAVMIYTVAGGGSLELAGCAGVDAALAEQWSHVRRSAASPRWRPSPPGRGSGSKTRRRTPSSTC